MDSMSPSNLLRSIMGPILCLLWLFCLATLTTGAATGVNRFSAFSQPVGPFTVIPNAEDESVVRLPTSHSSVRNFGGGEAPRAQQNIGIPLSFSPQTNQPSPVRDAQEPHRSPKFFVLNKESNGNANGRINAAVRSHFVAPGSQPRGIPLDAANQARNNGQRSSTGGSSSASTSAQAPNPSPRFFVLQDDGDLNVNGGASFAGSSGFRENTNGNGANVARNNGFRVNTNGNGAFSASSNGFRVNTNGNGANVGVPLPLGNQGNVDQQQPRSNGFAQSSNPSSTFFVVENSAEVEDNLATMSLGRRFHPNGIPIISDPIAVPSTKEAGQKTPDVQSPFLLTPNSLFVLKDDSIEDLRDADLDEQKIVVDLSPMVKAHNHNTANERLSLSNNFLNQYNFVDVKGSTSFGYKTDDQYQDHIVHRSGKHEGKFGWTAPEGSKHHIEYIADEKGYRVITSSGIYLDDEATVKAAKDNHFDEHKKVLDNLASIKRNNVLKSEQAPSVQSGTVGIPLPDTMINEQRESFAAAPQPGFVVIESDDDIPLLTQDPEEVVVPIQYSEDAFGGVIGTAEQSAAGSSASFGIPFPEVPARAESSPVETLQPTSSQGGSQFGFTVEDSEDIIVPIQYPEETFRGAATTAEKPLAGEAASSPAFGIPIPESPVRVESSPVEPSQPPSSQGGSQFGFTVKDSENIIVPIQYPVETFGGEATTAEKPIAGEAASSPTFGIPIPESPVRVESSPVEPSQLPSSQGGSQFGFTVEDPENVVVPIQYPEETFGGAATTAEKPLAGGSASSPTFGIPILESPVRAESSPVEPSQPTSSQDGSQFGITLQDPENVIVPIQYPQEAVGEAATAAEQPLAGGTASSPAFGISIPESPVRVESSLVEPSQPTSSQGENQFGFNVEDPENIIVPIQYPVETFGGAATTVEKPIAGEAAGSPAFGIPIPESPVRVESSPVEPSQSTSSQGGSQFGFTVEDPENVIVPIQYPEETFGGAATTAKKPLTGGSDGSPGFGIPIPESPVKAESSPVEPSQPTSFQDGSQSGVTLQGSESDIGTAVGETQLPEAEAQPMIPSEMAKTSVAEEEFFEIFGAAMSSNQKASNIPAAVTVESPKLSVKIGLDKTAPNQIEGFGVGLPSPTQTEEQDMNPITGTGGFTVITEDRPFIALNNVRDNVVAEPETFNAATDNFIPGGSTFSNQFFVVSPTNSNQGLSLFNGQTANIEGNKADGLLQGPAFANNENKNLIRRRS